MRMFREPTVDYLRYNKKFLSDKDTNVNSRGPLRLLSVFNEFQFNAKQIKYIKVVTAGRSRGTQDSYNRTLIRLNKYLKKKDSSILNLTEDFLLEYIIELEDTKAPFCRVSGLAGCIEFLCAALRLESLWTPTVERYYIAVIRRSAAEKKPRKKAALLPISVLRTAVSKYITPFLDNPDKVNFFYDIYFLLFYLTAKNNLKS